MIPLSLVYHFQSSQSSDGNFRPASYRVIYFFSEHGILEKKQLKELAKAVPEADHDLLTFLNLDDLKTFATRVCQELEAAQVRMISVQDYNIGLDGARNIKDFQGIFEKFGEILENEDAPKKKSFFGKFFN